MFEMKYEMDDKQVIRVFEFFKGNIAKTGRFFRVNRNTMRRKLIKLNLVQDENKDKEYVPMEKRKHYKCKTCGHKINTMSCRICSSEGNLSFVEETNIREVKGDGFAPVLHKADWQ